MIIRLLEKWFGLEPTPCLVCEALRTSLDNSERERRELLQRVLAPSTPSEVSVEKEEFVPIKPNFVPWRVRQQMLEAEDRKKIQLTREKEKEIDDLEKELDINASEK